MCGIAGFTGPKNPQRLATLGQSLVHRGPDASGTFEGQEISLIHRRLSILDLSENGRQPFVDESGKVAIIVNGEFYNFKPLREKLQAQGYRFKSSSDSEVLLHGYLEHGTEFFEKLRGMFAFAIWDERKKSLILGRDTVGIKPLYYCQTGSTLSFASEMNALIQSRVTPLEIDDTAYLSFLMLQFVPTPHTVIKNILKVPPGHYLQWSKQNPATPTLHPFRLLTPKPVAPHSSIDELLDNSIQSCLMSDVPIGVLLSGGLDSSLIAARASRFHEGTLKTYCAGFDQTDDETPYARIVAKHIQSDHHEFQIAPEKATQVLDKVIHHMDEPLADSGVLPTYLLANELKDNVKVVLVGEGADELFGGYLWHYLGHPRLSWLPNKWLFKSYRYMNSYFNPGFLKDRAGHEIFKQVSKRLYQNYQEQAPGHCTQNQRLHLFEIRSLLPNSLLMKVDKMTMAFSVEARVPYLDIDLMEAVLALPAEQKLSLRHRKPFLRRMAQAELPDQIINRRKHGFFSPLKHWMDHAFKERLLDLLKSENAHYRRFFSPNLHQKLTRPTSWPHRRVEQTSLLWRVFLFEAWFQERRRTLKSPV